jgi:hypothetical protein
MNLMKLRMRIWWEILVRPAWRWLILIPIGVLGYFQSVRDEFFSASDQAKYKILKVIPNISIEWFAVLILALVLIVVLESGYRSIIKRELQLKTFLDHYAYSLRLVRVDQEDRRGKDKDGQIVSRQMRFLLILQNTLDQPIRYSVRSLEVNGCKQQSSLSTGGVIAAHADTTYYTHLIDLPIGDIGRIYTANLAIEITYGPPDGEATRIMRKKILVEAAIERCTMLYENDTEEPFGV